jgi:predicted transcriptional regulator
MELGRPFGVVTPTIDADILTVLARADKQFTTGDLARMTGRSVRGLRLSLQRLMQQGVVIEQRAGKTSLYAFNAQHIAAEPLRALANLRATLLSRISEILASWETPAVFAALFGSGARGDMRPDSDLDLFVVRPDDVDAEDPVWHRQTSDLADQVTAWTGNDTRILDYTESRVTQTREPVLDSIASEGIPLFGPASWISTTLSGPGNHIASH